MNEISEELKKELGIENEEDFKKIVTNTSKMKENKKERKKMNLEITYSRAKQKQMTRKSKSIAEKKLKKENRENVLLKLEKYRIDDEMIMKLEGVNRKKKEKKEEEEEKMNIQKIEESDFDEDENENDSIRKDSISINNEEDKKKQSLTENNQDIVIMNGAYIKAEYKKILQDEIFEKYKLRQELEIMKAEHETKGNNIQKPKMSDRVIVKRIESIQSERVKLPIIKSEQEIVDLINNNLITVISGETGSGKSTQIPQFLYEYGYSSYGIIGITQPRRVATYSLSKRVSYELEVVEGEEVGYQVRNENKTSKNIKIKYMTEGILLKEIESDQLLSKYSVILIDEAHERTLNTDIIIGLLVRILKIRYFLSKNQIKYKSNNEEYKKIFPLRVVIMSATIAVEDFLKNPIFNDLEYNPKLYKIETRQYEVKVFQSKITSIDYFTECFKTICKIHSKLPDGGILCFLTGKKEINLMVKRLEDEFRRNLINEKMDFNKENERERCSDGKDESPSDEMMNIFNENERKDENQQEKNIEKIENIEAINNIVNQTLATTLTDTETDNYNNQEEQKDDEEKEILKYNNNYLILPLYSSLPIEEQQKIFNQNDNKRLIIISTNVAETSITIPSIKYVVDSGREKTRKFSLSYSEFSTQFISQASSEQRKGRAGRTGPGYCYRVYSNGVLGKMSLYNEPQILISSMDHVVLYLKSLNIKRIDSFPFLTKPNKEKQVKAIVHLRNINAIEYKGKSADEELLRHISNKSNDKEELNAEVEAEKSVEEVKDEYEISEIGRIIVNFPLPPRVGKILLVSNQEGLVYYGIVISAVMVMNDSLFMNSNNSLDTNDNIEDSKSSIKTISSLNSKYIIKQSDILTISNLFIDILSFIRIVYINNKISYIKNDSSLKKFIVENSLNHKLVLDTLDLILILLQDLDSYIKLNDSKANYKKQASCDIVSKSNKSNSLLQNKINSISKLTRLQLIEQSNTSILLQCLVSGLVDNIAKRKDVDKVKAYENSENDFISQVHISSLLLKDKPEYIVYKEIINSNGKTFLYGNSQILKEWIFNLGGDFLVKYNPNKEEYNLNDPVYSQADDCMKRLISFQYGRKNWNVSNVLIDLVYDYENKKEDLNYNIASFFGRFLLEGKIFPELKDFSKKYNSKTTLLTNKLCHMEKVVNFVEVIKGNYINSRRRLVQKLNENKNFLLKEILTWFNDDEECIKKKFVQVWYGLSK